MKGRQMKPERVSSTILGITRSKAKMYEYAVPASDHIEVPGNPAELFLLAIGLLGDAAAQVCNETESSREQIKELQKHLIFSAQFFDSYLQAKLNTTVSPYLLLMGSAAYYLCDLPGSATVLAKMLKPEDLIDNEERFLHWLLLGDFGMKHPLKEVGDSSLRRLAVIVSSYFTRGLNKEVITIRIRQIRERTYKVATPRELLFIDVCCAIILKRIANSTWENLPKYTNLLLSEWKDIIRKPKFIKELWPSQHMLGEYGVLAGRSSVVQMPTSAGKTKALELIIRSAFLAKRTNLAVIVAPFRALCHEIKNNMHEAFLGELVVIDEFSDAYQIDFDLESVAGRQKIIIVTPEKLDYVLRYNPEFSEEIGILIYDEGHQFDSGKRGITYELLLASLRTKVSPTTQVVLISAVINNAEQLNAWLNGEEGVTVPGADIKMTYRSTGFVSWTQSKGSVEFVDDIHSFYVPKVIEFYKLDKLKGDIKVRTFPDKISDSKDIALYLGLKLCSNGSVAIFCGRKDYAASYCEKIVKLYERNLSISPPREYSNIDQLDKLYHLTSMHFGDSSASSKCVKLGILSHHGNTPHGIRLATEHALQCSHAKFVVCTSTLAQGVNLPLKYLIISSVQQGKERIKVRDFHNLMGRAGRAGMYTEGSIIFTNTSIYDKRTQFREKWRWNQALELLDYTQAEDCTSNLLYLIRNVQILSDNRKHHHEFNFLDLLKVYYNNPDDIDKLMAQIASMPGYNLKTVRAEFHQKFFYHLDIITAVESYLLANWIEDTEETQQAMITDIVNNTLAYHLASDEEKELLHELFNLIAGKIHDEIPSLGRKQVFARTLFGAGDSVKVETWLLENWHVLKACETDAQILDCIWPLFDGLITNKTFINCNSRGYLKWILHEWVDGFSYSDLYEAREESLRFGTHLPKYEHLVEICEGAYAYEGMLIIAAIIEISQFMFGEDEIWTEKMERLQKRLKYGLSNNQAVQLYELGLSDRMIVLDLTNKFEFAMTREDIKIQLRTNKKEFDKYLEKFPEYFSIVLKNILSATT